MKLESNDFDVWVFCRTKAKVEYVLLQTSQYKADRYFNGGRFWQIPSGFLQDSERVVPVIEKAAGGVRPPAHGHLGGLDPREHAEARWCSFEEALNLVNYRGLKDGLRSTREYITGLDTPAAELRLR
jgi:hypothetical protein